jgi:tRNA (guanine37-N1)-methyltransferase
VRAFNLDGTEFIKRSISIALQNPFPPWRDPSTLKLKSKEPVPPTGPQRKVIRNYVMNLPDSAIEFLGSFRGIYAMLTSEEKEMLREDGEIKMPLVHCYCFSFTTEVQDPKNDIPEVRGFQSLILVVFF